MAMGDIASEVETVSREPKSEGARMGLFLDIIDFAAKNNEMVLLTDQQFLSTNEMMFLSPGCRRFIAQRNKTPPEHRR